jgi:superfamily II DNA or RNA helicase
MTTTLDTRVQQTPDLASLLEWATTTLTTLDLVDQRWGSAVERARDQLTDMVVPIDSEQTSVVEDLVAVVLPESVDEPLRNAADVMQRLAPVMEHAPALAVELRASLEKIEAARTRRVFGRKADLAAATAAANRLAELEHWTRKTGYDHGLAAALETSSRTDHKDVVSVVAKAAPSLQTVRQSRVAPLRAQDASVLGDVADRGRDLLVLREGLVAAAREDFEDAQARMVKRQLSDLPISSLNEASRGQVRTGALEAGGVGTVQQMLDRGMSVTALSGVSEPNARLAMSTARALQRECRDQLRLKVDWDPSDPAVSRLVLTLRRILQLDAQLDSHLPELEQLVELVAPLTKVLASGRDVVFLHRSAPRRGGDVAMLLAGRAEWVRRVGLADLLTGSGPADVDDAAAWSDFRTRVPIYLGLLGQIVGMEVDEEAAHGHLPAEVVQAVENQTLDTSFLSTDLRQSLRGYQAFGARYALAQRKVLLGDEMGLGKTIQALAVMAHLSTQGEGHFLVVCPPAVVVNWQKETRKHSTLEVHRLHGPSSDRQRHLQRWRQRGGVAVTSYNLVSSLELGDIVPGLVVVDEAHFVKNPGAQRSRAVRALAERSPRVLYMTGTPLENRVEDFTNLVEQLQPQIVQDIDPAAMVVGADRFRAAMAPVYLRRTQNDVLQEMPDRVEIEEWSDLSRAEADAYLDALDAKDFHGMRRVAMTADPANSEKLERLRELVDEAMSNHRKVLVYSYYRDVIEVVRADLGGRAFGVITGSTSPDERQRLVDTLTESSDPGVLISQISAGGLGLNMQAASVVILCEPQVKPSLESQAIARAHRMGQVQSVQVHRLLTTNSVDERMLEILARKSALFEQLAGRSEVAETSADAKDITEAALARQVLEQEAARLAAELRERIAARPAEVVPASPTRDDQYADQVGVVTPPTEPSNKPLPDPPASRPRPSRSEPASGLPRPAYRSAPIDTPLTVVCNSCDKPIDFNGHCGCS